VFNLPMALGAFRPPKPALGGPATVFPEARNKNGSMLPCRDLVMEDEEFSFRAWAVEKLEFVEVSKKDLPNNFSRSLLCRRRYGRGGHAYDSALRLLAVGSGGLAILAVDFELQGRSHNELRRLQRTAQFCAADILVGRRINDQVILLMLLLFAGGAHGFQVFESCCLDQTTGHSRRGKYCGGKTEARSRA
jgi:hypothetical protein